MNLVWSVTAQSGEEFRSSTSWPRVTSWRRCVHDERDSSINSASVIATRSDAGHTVHVRAGERIRSRADSCPSAKRDERRERRQRRANQRWTMTGIRVARFEHPLDSCIRIPIIRLMHLKVALMTDSMSFLHFNAHLTRNKVAFGHRLLSRVWNQWDIEFSSLWCPSEWIVYGF